MKKIWQNGFTLVEMSIVLLISAVIASAAIPEIVAVARDNKAQKIAAQMNNIGGATSTLISSSFDAIIAGGAVVGFANPLSPTVPELVAKGYLANNAVNNSLVPSGFNVLISKTPAGCVAPACDLNYLVYPSAGMTKNGSPDVLLAAKVSEKLGGNGGTSVDATPSTISGPNGSWTASNPLGAIQAVVALQGGFGAQGLSQFVRMGDTRTVTLNGGLINNGNATITGTTTSPTLSVGGSTITASTGGFGALTVTGNKNGWGGINFQTSPGVSAGTLMQRADYSGIYNPGDTGWAQLTQYNAGAAGTANGLTYMGTANAPQVVATNAQINGTATVGAGCTPNGLIARDGVGLILSCQSGSWKAGSWLPATATFRLVTGSGASGASATCDVTEALTGCSGSAYGAESITSVSSGGRTCVVTSIGTGTSRAHAGCSK